MTLKSLFCVCSYVSMADDLLPFGNDEAVSIRDTALTYTSTFQCLFESETILALSFFFLIIICPPCFCILQARNISTGELAAVKIIKLEPGEYEAILLCSRRCDVKSAVKLT